MPTPLAKKLGIRSNARLLLDGAPPGFEAVLGTLPDGVQLLGRARRPVDIVLCFCRDRRRLASRLPAIGPLLTSAGALWIAWPKRSSGVPTDLAFDQVQSAGLAFGLVDNKICAIDETWSALRFVYRLTDRPARRDASACSGSP